MGHVNIELRKMRRIAVKVRQIWSISFIAGLNKANNLSLKLLKGGIITKKAKYKFATHNRKYMVRTPIEWSNGKSILNLTHKMLSILKTNQGYAALKVWSKDGHNFDVTKLQHRFETRITVSQWGYTARDQRLLKGNWYPH